MQITFKNLRFELRGEKLFLTQWGNVVYENGNAIAQVQVCGENKQTHLGIKMAESSEGARLMYESHMQTENVLEIVERSELVRVKTTYTAYEGTNAVRVQTEVTNISEKEIILEEVSAFFGLGLGSIDDADDLYFTRFQQSHHAECQPRRRSFRDWGLFRANTQSQKRISFANVGSWSTKEELPQGIIENKKTGAFVMFQIESNSSWYYEIGDVSLQQYYLYLSGPNASFGGWSKALQKGESYRSLSVALAFGDSINSIVAEMTKYRRYISGKSVADANLPAIFNEYMHLSWDFPTEETTRKYAPQVAKTGVEYYVIDCGWHNEEPSVGVYPFVGQWKESTVRFPSGVRTITDYLRSLGMKAGLWIEPEVVGINCKEMLDYYDDDCFFQRNGRRVAVHGRYFLDYRNEKVRDYMSETIRRMVEDCGADYIKCDYNQDCGIGTDLNALTAGEGLQEAADAFLNWMQEMVEKYPNVIFEGCASGGMRMDYKTLGVYSLLSTSDQVNYLDYPYIAGNVLAAVLPEQAAVWAYPVGSDIKTPDVSLERIAVNMINSFLGRMHLASHIDEMNEEQLALVTEGVSYYNTLTEAKKVAVPYFPKGFTNFGDDSVVAGFKTDEKIYLAVWCLKGDTKVSVTIPEGIKRAKLAYPSNSKTTYEVAGKELCVQFDQTKCAAFFEIEI